MDEPIEEPMDDPIEDPLELRPDEEVPWAWEEAVKVANNPSPRKQSPFFTSPGKLAICPVLQEHLGNLIDPRILNPYSDPILQLGQFGGKNLSSGTNG
ncbi:MAG: hypothetical protein ACKOS8_08255 [Gemmataceae bacterium]